jgi:hypothetical protein
MEGRNQDSVRVTSAAEVATLHCLLTCIIADILARVASHETIYSLEGIDDAGSLFVQLWRLAHINHNLSAAVFNPRHFLLREAGYVFWNGVVGDTSDLLDKIEDNSWIFDTTTYPMR